MLEVALTPALSLSRERELPGSSVESIAARSVLGNCYVPVTFEVTARGKTLDSRCRVWYAVKDSVPCWFTMVIGRYEIALLCRRMGKAKPDTNHI